MANTFDLDEKRCKEVLEKLFRAREEGTTTDLTVIVKTENFKAHKSILVANSEYFRAMFTGSFNEKDKNFVELQNVSKTTFKFLLDYMYGKRLKFEEQSLEDFNLALDVADMLCLDTFINECKDYSSNWRKNLKDGSLSLCYCLSKKFKLIEIEDSIKMLVFEKFLNAAFQKDQEVVNFEDISLELFQDSLDIFENDEKMKMLLTEKDANSISSLVDRLTAIINWLTLNADRDFDVVKLLIDKYAKLEYIPPKRVYTVTHKKFQNIHPDHCMISAVNQKYTEIRQNIANTNLRVTAFRKDKLGFTLADYDSNKNTWNEIICDAEFDFQLTFVEGNLVYLVSNDQYAVFNLESLEMSEVKNIYQPAQLSINNCCIHVSNGFLYNLGYRCVGTGYMSYLVIKNLKNEGCKEHDLKQIYKSKFFLTVKNQMIYFINGDSIFSYDPELLELKYIFSCAQSGLTQPITFVVDSDHLTLFNRYNYYCRIPLKVNKFSRIIKEIDSVVSDDFYSCCYSTENELVYLSQNPANKAELHLHSTVSVRNLITPSPVIKFISVGFLPEQKLLVTSKYEVVKIMIRCAS